MASHQNNVIGSYQDPTEGHMPPTAADKGRERGNPAAQVGHADKDPCLSDSKASLSSSMGIGEEDHGAANKTDTQCAECDDGGFLLQCDGRCRRTFHIGGIYKVDEQGSRFLPSAEPPDDCNALSIPPDLALALIESSEPFLCPNCLSRRQMCFSCQEVGEEGVDVHPCMVAQCGRFYHPKCLLQNKRLKKGEHEPSEAAIICPLHTCNKCGESEDTEKGELISCRRCPTAYHENCVPMDILEDGRLYIAQRDENGELLPGCQVETSLLYCCGHMRSARGDIPHEKPLVNKGLRAPWARRYAKLFPHLEFSKGLLDGEAGVSSKGTSEGGGEADNHSMSMMQLSAPRSVEDIACNDRAKPESPQVTRKSARSRALQLLATWKHRISKETVRNEMKRPLPFDWQLKKTIDEGILLNLERTLRYAQTHISDGKQLGILRKLVGMETTKLIAQKHADLYIALTPYLKGLPYVSYGRQFTDLCVVKIIAQRVVHFLRDKDCVVDFSCGPNEFLPMVKGLALDEGIVITGRAYDIIVPRNLMDFKRAAWLETSPEIEYFGDPDNLVIGLKPPFGKDRDLADKFIRHALLFRPRLMVLIVPPHAIVPDDYIVVLEDTVVCKVDDFYYPGSSVSFPFVGKRPVFRILAREDLWSCDMAMAFVGGGDDHELGWIEVPSRE